MKVTRRPRTGAGQVPRSLIVAVMLVGGVLTADTAPWWATISLPMAMIAMTVACWLWRRNLRANSKVEDDIPGAATNEAELDARVRGNDGSDSWHRQRQSREEVVAILLTAFCLGSALWFVRGQLDDRRDIGLALKDGLLDIESPVRIMGVVDCIPAMDTVIDGRPFDPTRGQQPRTMLLVNVESALFGDRSMTMRGVCRVMIDGDATSSLAWGDRVQLTGHLDLPARTKNPGEFDFARFLARRRISAMMFVNHVAAVEVVERNPSWHPKHWLNVLRQQTVQLMRDTLSDQNRATAEALLLGNRGHLTPELERDFIASGTMHLLAISGLHVGILFVFLVRVMNVLLVGRTRALLVAGFVCVMYMLLTDLRPSVVRATAFIVLMIVGQLLGRDVKMGSLIGVTTLVLVLFDPSIVFDTGAWLSFLAVGALGWVAFRAVPPKERPVPLDALDWREHLADLRVETWQWLQNSYRQILAVTLLSAPLIATQFHLVTLTGMVINIVLIPFTTFVLIIGYVFVAVGVLLPHAGWLLSWFFGAGLSVLNGCVAIAADVQSGFLTIPDLPHWFLSVFYGLLLASAFARRSPVRGAWRLALMMFVIVQLWVVCQRPKGDGLVCTVLSIGHGNAVVVEAPDGRVLVFDAGALNRGQRTADVVSRFLWQRGHRMIDTIIVSHPDADHYNAVNSLLQQMPIGQLVTTTEFARSGAAEVQAVIDRVQSLGIPIVLAMQGDKAIAGECMISFHKADLQGERDPSDNENSLVAVLEYHGHRICLPGDLEGAGQKQLLASLPRCDVLVCPHHGSPHSSLPEFAIALEAKTVIVSARDDRNRAFLDAVYAPARVLFTSQSGAVQVAVSELGLQVDEFVKSE